MKFQTITELAALKHFTRLTVDDVTGHVGLRRLSSCPLFSSAACQRAVIWGTVFAHEAHDNHRRNGCKPASAFPSTCRSSESLRTKLREKRLAGGQTLAEKQKCRFYMQTHFMLCASLSLISGEGGLVKFHLSGLAPLQQANISLLGLIWAIPLRPPHIQA